MTKFQKPSVMSKAKVMEIVIAVFILLANSACLNKAATPAADLSPIPTWQEGNTSEPIFTPIPTVVEPGLARGYPCKPPCWRGLWPGRSTGQEVEQALEQLRLDGWAKQIIGNPVDGYYIFPLSAPAGIIHVTVANDTVKTIYGDIRFDYPLSQAVKQFGNPEGTWPLIGSTQCTSCDNVELSTTSVWSTRAYLLYPEKGLLFVMQVPPEGKGCMCPSMRILNFCYYKPISLEEALDNNYLADLCPGGLRGVTKEDLVKWHGFGRDY